MKIAIDGPSASGKGTIAKLLAEKYNLSYLNTGKIYRIVSMASIENNILPEIVSNDENFLNYWNKYKDNDLIYSENNTKNTSKISAIPIVRQNLLQFQRDFVKNNKNVILEGRDIGTVIMPDADIKIYLDASAEVRAMRRFRQSNQASPYENILEEIKQRDLRDSTRENAALKISDDAIIIDSTNMTIHEVMEKISNLI